MTIEFLPIRLLLADAGAGTMVSNEAPVAESPVTTVPASSDPLASITEATSTLVQQMVQGDFTGMTDYATTHLAPSLISAAVALLIIFMAYLVGRYLQRVISRPVCRRIDETLGIFVGKMTFYCVLGGVTAAVLSRLGAPLGGLAAMLAAAGFAIGLAFQGTLSNFAGGVMMLVFRPFKVGDMINAAGVTGKVKEIDLFTTIIDTPDNRRIIVPNSSIAGHTIENITHHAHRRVEVLVGIDYGADLNETRAALQRAIDSLSTFMIQGENRGGAVILGGLGNSSVDWKVRMWVATANFWPMTDALTAAVKTELDASGIRIPFPQMDVHVKQFPSAVTGESRGAAGLAVEAGAMDASSGRVRPTRRAVA